MLRKLISGLLLVMIVPMPSSLFAAEPQAAVLYGTGAVFLNGAQLANSSAVASGDVIQTRETGTASLNAAGSSVAIDSNTIVRFQGTDLALDRGSVSVASGSGMAIMARDFKITPVSNAWTQFYISRVDGAIQVMARKNSVTINCGANTVTVKEGEQISREDADNCGIADKDPGAAAAAKGPVFNSKWAEIGAAGGGGFLLGWVVGRHEDVSPSKP